jgi:uncharacterized membrane protein YraQ (UPF0718 family)
MAHAFVQSGVTHGQAVAYLIAGPITSYGTILVVQKVFGLRILLLYLGFIVAFSLMAGVAYDRIFLPQ